MKSTLKDIVKTRLRKIKNFIVSEIEMHVLGLQILSNIVSTQFLDITSLPLDKRIIKDGYFYYIPFLDFVKRKKEQKDIFCK